MVRVGIDVGSLYTKGLMIAEDRRVLAMAVEATTNDVPGLTQTLFTDLLAQAGCGIDEVDGLGDVGSVLGRV